MSLSIAAHEEGPALVVGLTGDLDASTGPQIDALVLAAIDGGRRLFIFDLTGLRYILRGRVDPTRRPMALLYDASRKRRWLRGAGALLLLAALPGCRWRPSAPALRQGEAVYQNPQESFHFQTPEGWREQVRTEAPAGPVPVERTLVKYKHVGAGKNPAFLRVSLVDVPEARGLNEVLREQAQSRDPREWPEASAPQDEQVNGLPAARIVYTGYAGREKLVREAVAVRRGGRVFFFTGTFPAADAAARAQAARAVQSVVWE